MDKKSIVNDLYQAAVISVLAVGYSMLGKKILKIAPPSVQRFDLENTGKLVPIVAASETLPHLLLSELDNFYQNGPELYWLASFQPWYHQNCIRYFLIKFLMSCTNVKMMMFYWF